MAKLFGLSGRLWTVRCVVATATALGAGASLHLPGNSASVSWQRKSGSPDHKKSPLFAYADSGDHPTSIAKEFASVNSKPNISIPTPEHTQHLHRGADQAPPLGQIRDGLPNYTVEEVQTRNGKDTGASVWVTYGNGVFDITEFVEGHPGGDVILMAAGGSIEPFWNMYAQHKQDFVYELLDGMRIGNLIRENDSQTCSVALVQKDPYALDPERNALLVVRSQKPFNAEPPPDVLINYQVTPNEFFYVRNHLPVPVVDPNEYRLEIEGLDGSLVASYSLRDIKERFVKHTVAAAVQCAGNRRDEMSAVKTVKGGSWEIGAISNAVWSGARLRDVLANVGISTQPGENFAFKHVVMEGLDSDPLTGQRYGASIPRDIVERVPDVLLAYEMNGEELPRDHGYPIRLIVPGVVGARSVKWLGRVAVSPHESSSHWQTSDYKGFCPSVDWENVDFSTAPAIQELPVVSAICKFSTPGDKTDVLRVEGYAWSGDGKDIVRVDVSADGGKTWSPATLLPKESPGGLELVPERNRVYDWRRWSIEIPTLGVGAGTSKGIELVCKAVDSAYNTQPERVESIWNLRGLLNNAWHRVDVDASSRNENIKQT